MDQLLNLSLMVSKVLLFLLPHSGSVWLSITSGGTYLPPKPCPASVLVVTFSMS